MYILKGCGKCKGDLCSQEDMYGFYLKCLQCGRITEEATRKRFVSNIAQSPPQKKAA